MTSATDDFTARPSNDNRGRIILLVGLGLGIAAAIMVAIILSDSETRETLVPATRVAVVTTQDIPARTRLTRNMVEVRTYEVKDIDADAFTTVGQVLNRVTATDLVAGEPILPSAVSLTTGEGLTFSVTEGMRAVSIGVSEVVTAGGNLAPGNHVDIVGFFNIPQGSDVSGIIAELTGERPPPQSAPQDATLTFTILQNVKILAVAQDLTPEAREPTGQSRQPGAIAEQQAPNQSNRANPRAATVTIEVTPQQVQAMATADLLGTLRLSLRAFGDDEQVRVTPTIVLLRD
jgi:pilus assembly protein CpaB